MLEGESIDAPYDAPLRWVVRSSSEGHASYLVDLGANDCIGECQCAHFMFVVKPNLRKGQIRRCRHINIARERFLNWSIKAFKEQDKNLATDHHDVT